MALPFTLKGNLNTKEELWNFKIFQKNHLKRKQNPSRYHNSRTNLKFQHKSKYHLLKIMG